MRQCQACGAPNPNGQLNCYACHEWLIAPAAPPPGGSAYTCGQVPTSPNYMIRGLYDSDKTLTVLKRLAAMATGTRLILTLGNIFYGLINGVLMSRLMGVIATSNEFALAIITVIGAASGGFIGYWIGKILSDFAVVWIEWAAQMLAASDAIVVGQDNANQKL